MLSSIIPNQAVKDLPDVSLVNSEPLTDLALRHGSGKRPNLSNHLPVKPGRGLPAAIVACGQWAHVIGVYTTGNLAQMIRHPSFRERAVSLLEVVAMRARLAAIDVNAPVALMGLELPNPTRRVVSTVLLNVRKLRIGDAACVVSLQEPHRLTEHPSQFGVRCRRWIRRAATAAFAQLHEGCAAITLCLLGGATVLAGGVQSRCGGISSRNVSECLTRQIALARVARFADTLPGHRSGPFAAVTRPRWLPPRGGLSCPNYTMNPPILPEKTAC